MQQIVKIAIILLASTLIWSCKKDEVTPVPPVISFLDARMADDNSYSIVRKRIPWFSVKLLRKSLIGHLKPIMVVLKR